MTGSSLESIQTNDINWCLWGQELWGSKTTRHSPASGEPLLLPQPFLGHARMVKLMGPTMKEARGRKQELLQRPCSTNPPAGGPQETFKALDDGARGYSQMPQHVILSPQMDL